MKFITHHAIIIIAGISFFQNNLHAQVINWENVSKQNKHLVHAHAGAEFGMTAGLGYHHFLPVKCIPVWVGGEFSVPAGNRSADDFKLRLGAITRVATYHLFQFSLRIQGISRRYQTQAVSIFNFGSDMAGTLGYYRRRWFFGTEAGFDKAIVSNYKHSEWFKRNIYGNVQDGWYEPATGGNFYYGLQGGYSMKRTTLSFKAGKTLQQDLVSRPLLPFYGQLGLNFCF